MKACLIKFITRMIFIEELMDWDESPKRRLKQGFYFPKTYESQWTLDSFCDLYIGGWGSKKAFIRGYIFQHKKNIINMYLNNTDVARSISGR